MQGMIRDFSFKTPKKEQRSNLGEAGGKRDFFENDASYALISTPSSNQKPTISNFLAQEDQVKSRIFASPKSVLSPLQNCNQSKVEQILREADHF